MISATLTEVRTLHPGEVLPPELPVGFKCLDPDWVWVACEDGAIVAALITAPCHGMVMAVQLVAIPGHVTVMPGLLRQWVRDSVARGYNGYLCHLDTLRPEERRLLGILKRGGCVVWPREHTCVGGSFAELGRW